MSFFPYRIQQLCQPNGLCLLRRPDTHLGTYRPADTFHPGSAVLRLGACHYSHGDQQVGRTPINRKMLHFLYDGWITHMRLTAVCQSFTWHHRCGIFVSLKLDFFWNSVGGLILDKTVSNPNFAGMAVFTPVINGETPYLLVSHDSVFPLVVFTSPHYDTPEIIAHFVCFALLQVWAAIWWRFKPVESPPTCTWMPCP